MSVRPFGSVAISYCSFGGRTAADETAVARYVTEPASSRLANVRTRRDVISLIILYNRSFVDEPESGERPMQRLLIERVGVRPPLVPGEQLNGRAAAIDAHAALDAAALLRISLAQGGVDAEDLA